ncbi:Hypothetical predicted protein [Paramuricea clavata]|uniref:Uncharacterized protein n=1 Tax=Paramuricea clavata TaxID=317549 RepID=A0A6S7HFC4_PARCT|nr:Hypothetical predicted protein [Paramuricea clavata]
MPHSHKWHQHYKRNTISKNGKTFIIHCGTNDLEQIDASQILVKLKTLENQLHKKYPQSRVIISLLLPRADKLNGAVNSLNETIQKEFKDIAHTALVEHNNITPQ